MLETYNFTELYSKLFDKILNHYEFQSQPRDMRIRECLGVSFKINNIRDRLPVVPERDYSLAYQIAENLWYLSGNNSTEWISRYSSFWKNISDDGTTANSAYGARIFKHHEYQTVGAHTYWTQWDYIKKELRQDSDSRRAVIHIRMPQDSMLASKDVPCTLALQFFLRSNYLHQVVSMRSSDLVRGLVYDVPAFMLFQELLALELNVRCGSYTHISNSLHLYEKHFPMAERIIKDTHNYCVQPLPPITTSPPIDLMMELEEKLWNQPLNMVVYRIDDETGLTSYWKDWMYILAHHKAQKNMKFELANPNGSVNNQRITKDYYERTLQDIRDKISFEGYKRFMVSK